MIRWLKGGNTFNLLTIIGCVAFGLMAVYWLAAIVFAVVLAAWGLLSWLAAKVLRGPMRRLAIPAALKLQIGRTRFTAFLGVLVIAACLVACTAIIRQFHEPALRRVGQGIGELKPYLGEYADKVEAVAGEGIGYQRYQRWSEWVWAEDVSGDDTQALLAQADNTVPTALFDLSSTVNRYGLDLESRVFEGERHPWFTCVYWFFAAVFVPFLFSTFLVTVYQLSARRLTTRPGLISSLLQGLSTVFICYSLFTAFYLFPYVSHPYHTIGVPYWAATILYLVAAVVCCGVVRANQDVLFSSVYTPDASTASAVVGKEPSE